MKRFLSLLLVIFAFLGVLDAGYLTYEKVTGTVPPCNLHFKCGQVLNSPWASIGPIPLSALGMAFYSLFLLNSLLFYFGKTQVRLGSQKIKFETVLFTQGLFGGGFSLYLVFIMGVVLKAWCFYCVLSALTCLALLLVSTTLFIRSRSRSSLPSTTEETD
jgi:uncharacterized membrane protein